MTEDAGGELEPKASGVADACLGLALAVAALVVRALSFPSVFTAGGIRLVDPDAHYHLRRILWTVENFPAVLRRDPYVAFPFGGEPIWPPAFDWAIAALARLFVGRGDQTGVETLAVWVPPALGAATVAAVFWLGRRAFDRRAGVVAAAMLCLLPAHVGYTQIGFVDHHAAEALFVALLLGATLRAIAARDRDAGADLAAFVRLGGVMGLALVVWPGCLLHVFVVQAALVVWLAAAAWREPADPRASSRATGAAVAHGAAFLLVAPFAIGRTWASWGDVSPVVLSGFQPLWLGLPTIGLGLCAVAWRPGSPASSTRVARIAVLFAALAVPALLSFLVPSVRDGIGDAATWLLRKEPFQAVVAESLPLFSNGRELALRRAGAALTPLVWLLPVVVAALVWSPRQRVAHRLLAFFCVALFAATVAQYRFANPFSVVWAIAIGASFDLAWRALAGRRRPVRLAAGLAATAVALLVLAPLASTHARAFATARRVASGELVHAEERVAHHEALVDAAHFLRAHSPATAGWLEPGATPRYGVLAAWGDGHVIRYVARRPVVQDNFGDDVGSEAFALAERYFAARSEDEALAIASALRVRYVLVRAAGSGHAPEPYDARSMLVRLHRLRGSAGTLRGADSANGALFVPALSRHRLLYESRPTADDPDGRFALYEIVKSARVEGTALPGKIVTARLRLADRSAGGEALEYRVRARAGPDGRYRLLLPYATTHEPAAESGARSGSALAEPLSPAGPYALESGGRVAVLHVDETDVEAGARVEGPDLVP